MAVAASLSADASPSCDLRISQFLGSDPDALLLQSVPSVEIVGKEKSRRDRRNEVKYLVRFPGHPFPGEDGWFTAAQLRNEHPEALERYERELEAQAGGSTCSVKDEPAFEAGAAFGLLTQQLGTQSQPDALFSQAREVQGCGLDARATQAPGRPARGPGGPQPAPSATCPPWQPPAQHAAEPIPPRIAAPRPQGLQHPLNQDYQGPQARAHLAPAQTRRRLRNTRATLMRDAAPAPATAPARPEPETTCPCVLDSAPQPHASPCAREAATDGGADAWAVWQEYVLTKVCKGNLVSERSGPQLLAVRPALPLQPAARQASLEPECVHVLAPESMDRDIDIIGSAPGAIVPALDTDSQYDTTSEGLEADATEDEDVLPEETLLRLKPALWASATIAGARHVVLERRTALYLRVHWCDGYTDWVSNFELHKRPHCLLKLACFYESKIEPKSAQ